MAEVFVEYAEPVISKSGRVFMARACGAEMDASRWQGWIEFIPLDSGAVLRSGRETTQPNRTDTEYWATGLTPIYLEGALDRALHPLRVTAFSPPLAQSNGASNEALEPAHIRESVLNPFSVYRNGESLLRNRLSALSGWHLVNIIEAYGLSERRAADLAAISEPVLVDLIVEAVQKRTLAQP